MFHKYNNLNHGSDCLILTGMHRSGTSLLASYLQHCGLDIGEDLLGPDTGNKKGYFEDKAFVQYHKNILSKNHCHQFRPKPLKFEVEDIARARELINSKVEKKPWGWKDPRTTLFLDFWKALLPKANFLFLYRHPYQVIDSLRRRGTDPVLKIVPFLAANSWLTYNKILLNFYRTHQKKVIIFSLQNFLENAKKCIKLINKEFDLILEERKINTVFDANLLKREFEFGLYTKAMIRPYTSELLRVYSELQETSLLFWDT